MPEPDTAKLYTASALFDFADQVLQAFGVSKQESRVVADNLVTANLRGIDSHGITRLPLYIERLESGLIAARTDLEVVRQTPGTCVLDAHNGWGAVAGMAGMRQAIARARQVGAGVALVRHSNHFGIAAYYTGEAVAAGMIGVAMTNASANMPPWGARQPYFGTNPICVAVPAGRERPVIYDGATSVVAIGKLVLAAKKGERIPPTWATDEWGQPTTDPRVAIAAGNLLPMGGYKGYGLALMVDVLSGILAGAAFGPHVSNLRRLDAPQNVGHFFAALDIAAFADPAEFAREMEQLVQEIRDSPRVPGCERVFLPGEIEWEFEEQRRREGIPVPPEVQAELQHLGKRCGVALLEAGARH
jgi:LDH2 family malate/lactate/ureidoglycolate dehydrogenase